MRNYYPKIASKRKISLLLVPVLLLSVIILQAGCAEEDPADNRLEIAGEYAESAFGESINHLIGETTWTISSSYGISVFDILSYDNDLDYLTAQNGADNDYNPDLFSRLDWTTYQSDLYYCFSSYNATTEQEAAAADGSDRTDPTAGGCGLPDSDFPWSLLTPLN